MDASFFLAVLVEILIAVIHTEASPEWRWNPHSNHRSWHKHRVVRSDGCYSGQCVQVWKCPETAISERPTGGCAYWSNGPWVCCVLAENSNYPEETHGHPPKFITKSPDISSELNPKITGKNRWKQKTTSATTKNYWKDKKSWNTAPDSDDTWNRYGRKKPDPIISMGDLPSNSWGRPNDGGTWDTSSEYPNFDGWKKTTSNVWNKRTTSNPQNSGTTKHKSSTSGSRIIFPTEMPSWTKQTTKRATVTVSKPKPTNAYDRKTTSRPWTQPSRTTSSIPHWNPNPGRSTPRTPRPTNTRKPFLSTRATNNVGLGSDERRNQGSGRSTPRYPVIDTITEYRNAYTPSPRSSTTRSTTTRRNRITTPLPNVNTYYCGIREQSPRSNQRGRNNNGYADTGPRNSRGRQTFQRIVGGEEAEPYSWPWVAALYKVSSSGANRFLSAGSLINENFILTAAHPFTRDDIRSSSYVVMLGTHNAEDSVAQYLVSSVLQHPQYEQRFYYHDIALLRLERPVTFNDFVMPVCLPSPNAPLLRDRDLEGKNVTVMGWGDESFGGKTSRVLKEATFPIVSRSSCNASYVRVASNRFPRGITENMLCAGDPNGGKDACQGDSGGPLTSYERGRYTQVGIVSFGYQCGDKEFPGVYTKVAPYLSWIAENTERARNYNYDYYG